MHVGSRLKDLNKLFQIMGFLIFLSDSENTCVQKMSLIGNIPVDTIYIIDIWKWTILEVFITLDSMHSACLVIFWRVTSLLNGEYCCIEAHLKNKNYEKNYEDNGLFNIAFETNLNCCCIWNMRSKAAIYLHNPTLSIVIQ